MMDTRGPVHPTLPGRRLRITWVLLSLRMTGGVRVVYEHTRQLLARGHEVTLVAPAQRPGWPFQSTGRRQLQAWLLDRFVLRTDEALRFYGLEGHVRTVASLDPAGLPDGDVVIATAWQTAPAVAAAPARCGRGAYFIQHYEVFAPGIEEQVDATWRLPLERIVIARWLAGLARERFGVPTHGPVPNGVNLELFHDRGRVTHRPLRVGMMYDTMDWKGSADGLEAVRLARREVPGVQLLLFGRPRLRHRLEPGDRYERNPTQERLAALYRECDIFLSPSWAEGFGLPPLEAMASGCALVSTDVGAMHDHFTHEVHCLLAGPKQPAALAAHLVRLATDDDLRHRIATAGRDHVRTFTWARATDELERVLRGIAGEAPR